jgi:phospholipase C
VGTDAEVSDTWAVTENNLTAYDLTVYGPNGYVRAFRGSISGAGKANLHVRTEYDKDNNAIRLFGVNRSRETVTIRFTNGYTGEVLSADVKAGESGEREFSLHHTFGWYDFTIEVEQDSSLRYQLAGHVETGEESRTDPAIAAS